MKAKQNQWGETKRRRALLERMISIKNKIDARMESGISII
tara:strand:+ start:373 stop:492 length:120 start_codon:yes stop_codon:yes gene_type:complete